MKTQTDSPRGRIAANVSAEMRRRRLYNHDLAGMLGWSLSATQRRTSGEAAFDAEHLLAVAHALDVPITAFFEGVSTPGYPSNTGGKPITQGYPRLRRPQLATLTRLPHRRPRTRASLAKAA